MSGFTVRLEQWTVGDRPLLERLNTPEMMRHLGGPESDEKIDDRLRRYVAGTTPQARCFKVVLDPAGPEAGSVVYWEHDGAVTSSTRPDGASPPSTRDVASRRPPSGCWSRCDVEHPPGSIILRCNEWRIDLRP